MVICSGCSGKRIYCHPPSHRHLHPPMLLPGLLAFTLTVQSLHSCQSEISSRKHATPLSCSKNKILILYLVGVFPALSPSTLSTLHSPAPLTANLHSAPERDRVLLLLSLAFASPVIHMLGPFSSLRCQIKSLLLQEALPDCPN